MGKKKKGAEGECGEGGKVSLRNKNAPPEACGGGETDLVSREVVRRRGNLPVKGSCRFYGEREAPKWQGRGLERIERSKQPEDVGSGRNGVPQLVAIKGTIGGGGKKRIYSGGVLKEDVVLTQRKMAWKSKQPGWGLEGKKTTWGGGKGGGTLVKGPKKF